MKTNHISYNFLQISYFILSSPPLAPPPHLLYLFLSRVSTPKLLFAQFAWIQRWHNTINRLLTLRVHFNRKRKDKYLATNKNIAQAKLGRVLKKREKFKDN